jgi:hypothetical protein
MASFAGTWDQYSFAPTSRTVSPVRILSSGNPYIRDWPGQASLQGNGSILIFDFCQEVSGIAHLTYTLEGLVDLVWLSWKLKIGQESVRVVPMDLAIRTALFTGTSQPRPKRTTPCLTTRCVVASRLSNKSVSQSSVELNLSTD